MIQRHLVGSLDQALLDTPVVFLAGPRQSGKTTLARNLAATRGGQYTTLDEVFARGQAGEDPEGFVAGHAPITIIDEVQRVPALALAIKAAVDRDRRPGRFLLTGSAAVMVLPQVADALVGRMQVATLWPFSQAEIEGAGHGWVDRFFEAGFEPPPGPFPAGDAVIDRVIRGGFPEVVLREGADRRTAWFEAYASLVLDREVRSLVAVEDLSTLPRLLRALAARNAQILNTAELSRDIRLPATTLTRHLTLLEGTFLTQRIPAWSTNIGKRLTKAPKGHLVDSGLAAHLLGLDAGRLRGERSLFGHLFEGFVVGELQRDSETSRTRPRFHHLRTQTGDEVDLVLESRAGDVVAVEVKASVTLRSEDLRALGRLREAVGGKWRTGIVAYLGDTVQPAGPGTWAVPVSMLWSTPPPR